MTTEPLYAGSSEHFFGLDVEINEDAGDAMRIRVAGELDLATSETLSEELEGVAAAAGGREIVLDLSGLTFMDSTGLRALWNVRQRVQSAGGTLVLRAPSAPVMRVLQQTKLHKVFQFADEEV